MPRPVNVPACASVLAALALGSSGTVLVALAATSAAAAERTDTRMLDLSTGTVDGTRVLGRSVAGVTAALGRPDFRLAGGECCRIGWGTPTEFSIEVLFRHSRSAWRSWSIVFRRGGLVVDVRIGDLPNRPSPALQHQVIAKYGKTYRLVRMYACRTKGFCSGEFAQRGGLLHFAFGTERRGGTWVTLWTSV
jgi:hypothetical protein